MKVLDQMDASEKGNSREDKSSDSNDFQIKQVSNGSSQNNMKLNLVEQTKDKIIVQREIKCLAVGKSRRRLSRRLSAAFIDLSNLEIDPNPFDQSLNTTERFFKASLTAYTELLGIDQVHFQV